MFADDTSLTYANGDLKKLQTEINEEPFKVCSWLVVNKLILNIEETNYIIFRPSQKTISFHPSIKIINNNSNTSQPLEMKNYIGYLGILIDSNLSCNISNMRRSVSSPDETPRRELKIRRAAEYF